MRVLTVVTLITPNGEYGGPVRVALNHASALIDAGHTVTVIAAARGFGEDLPKQIGGVPVRLFPARTTVPGTGFAGITARGMSRWIRQEVGSFDMVHIHAARDLVTLPVAMWLRRHKIPYVLQTHGMIDASTNPLAPVIDATMTRPVLRAAKAVFFLTEKERIDLESVAGDTVPLRLLRNGVPHPSVAREETSLREVLFLARLAPRKRPIEFVMMAKELLMAHPDVQFTLIGPDEGEGLTVERLIAGSDSDRIRWNGPLDPDRTTARMAQAEVYVLPAVDEPYPMSVLEAMSVGLPVVVTDSCGLAESVRIFNCGVVVDSSQASLNSAVSQLLSDSAAAIRMGRSGAAAARDSFGMAAISDELVSVYRD